MFDTVYRVVLGPAVILSLLVTGGYLSLRLKLFWVFHPLRAVGAMRGSRGVGGSFRAVCMALAGTLGVGNIAGVALALMLGGAGAVFWMLLSAFFAMAVKYAEVLLAMDTRKGKEGARRGGAPLYMMSEGRGGRILPICFSALCVICALLQGSVIQGSAAAEAIGLAVGVKPAFAGIALALCAALVLTFGRRGIARVTAVAIPLATVVYLVMCLAVLVVMWEALPVAVLSIFRNAFSPSAGVGGVVGYLFSAAARQGCAKGLLSNEAGCGTAPMAHITAEGTTPVGQALWGVFEVFLDTTVICTMTALVCLCVMPSGSPDAPIAFITAVFTPVFGKAAIWLTSFSIVAFAFATTLTWSFYGTSCLANLTSSKWANRCYLVLYCGALIWGGTTAPTILYTLTDCLLALMTLINLTVLAKKADRVCALSAAEGMLPINYIHECGTARPHR